MATQIEVQVKTAEKLRKLAEAQNVSIDQLLATYVPGLASQETSRNGSEIDLSQAFDEWAAAFPKDTPPLSDDAVSRASIYRDR